MKLTRTLLLAALLVVPACAAGAAPGPADIRLPQPAVVPSPMPPAPAPGGVVTLAGDELYVIDSSVDVVVRSHPRGLIKFEKKKPGTYYAKFAGGAGRLEEKEFAGPFVWVGKATGKGTVTLDVIPKGGIKDETDIVTAAVDVDATKNAGPDVAPVGPNPPTPQPPAPADPLAAALQKAFDQEPANVGDKSGKAWTKQEYAAKLAALYAKAAEITVPDETVKTYGDLFGRVAAAGAFPDAAMPKLKAAVGAYLDEKLKPSSLKAIDRDACKAEFQTIAKALNGVK